MIMLKSRNRGSSQIISFNYYNQSSFRILSKMVWYFNFCSPHLNDDNNVNINRTIMVVQVVLAMLITFIVHMLAQLYDEESNRVKNEADPPADSGEKQKNGDQTAMDIRKNSSKVHDDNIEVKSSSGLVSKGSKSNEPGFFKNKRVFFLTVQTVENKSPCFLGHFAIVITACAMYSPFIMQTLLGMGYIIAVILMLVFEAWRYERLLLISVAATYICNLALMTSAVVGVGLTNWDPFTIDCYYTKLKM